MRFHRLVIGVAVATGCRDPGLSQLEQIKAEVCACTTSSCGKHALERVPQSVDATPRSQKIARETVACLARLVEAERSAETPEPPADEPPAAGESPAAGEPPAPAKTPAASGTPAAVDVAR